MIPAAIVNIVVFGATSAIAQALARRVNQPGARFFLAGRDPERLNSVSADLIGRGAQSATIHAVDFGSEAALRTACAAAHTALGRIDLAVIAHGALPDQRALEQGAASVGDMFMTNLVSASVLMVTLSDILRAQDGGMLIVLGSVAGDRGKASNYLYGAAKSGLATVQQGVIARLHGTAAKAMLVKLGFVDTPMTASFRKGLLWVSPDAAASAIVRAIVADRTTIYVPWFWRWIMLALRMLPDKIFVRLGL